MLRYRKPVLALTACCILLLTSSLNPQRQVWERIRQNLATLCSDYPQEMTALHTDRSLYQAGEQLWFKAWHVAGPDHRPSRGKIILTLELIDPFQRVIRKHLLQASDGRACGSLLLPDTLTEGKYILQLSSGWMQNFDPAFFSRTEIHLVNPADNRDSRGKSSRLQDQRPSITFHPEGGVLLTGQSSRIGIMATDAFGKGIAVQGMLRDGQGKALARVSTRENGLGSFTFTPQDGDKYFLELDTEGGKRERHRLPEARADGARLTVRQERAGTRISFHQAGLQGPFLILTHHASRVAWWREIPANAPDFAEVIPEKDLLPGLHTVTAFDAHGIPVSERVFFAHPDVLNPGHPDLKAHPSGDSLEIRFSLPPEGSWAAGSVSASITQVPEVPSPFIAPEHKSLATELFLHVGSNGSFTLPASILTDTLLQKSLEDLMLMSTWSWHPWDKLREGTFPVISHTNQSALRVSGKVTKHYLNLPARDVIVRMTVMDQYFDQFFDTTGDDGRFGFGGLQYEDSIHLMLEARYPDGGKNLIIELDGWKEERSSHKPRFSGTMPYQPGSLKELGREMAGSRHGQAGRAGRKGGIHREADHVIRFDGVNQIYGSPLEALVNVPGVEVFGSGMNTRVIIRGISSLILSNEPHYVVDGVPADRYTVNSIYSGDVDRIEVLSGTKAAIYGVQGGNGVIAVFTKRGSGGRLGELTLHLAGFTGCDPSFRSASLSGGRERIPVTLQWHPMLEPDSTGQVRLRIPLPAGGGQAYLRAEAISEEGYIFSVPDTPLPRMTR